MRSLILACVLLVGCLAVTSAEAQQYFVPNMARPYGGTWYWARPSTPVPYYPRYYSPYYSPYYNRSFDDWKRWEWDFFYDDWRRHRNRPR